MVFLLATNFIECMNGLIRARVVKIWTSAPEIILILVANLQYTLYNLIMELILKEEAYRIIGICMEVHNHLGAGFLEIVYKDALEYEFRCNGIPHEREKEYLVHYKGAILPHRFYADFVVYDTIILEVKCKSAIAEEHVAQAINYLKVSGNKLALVVNYGGVSLNYKRIVF